MNNSMARRFPFGTTLTELLAVLLIIALLATIAVPVAIKRMQQGKVATAREEVATLARGEESVAITHGFYVPLQVLDNLAIDFAIRDNETDDLQNEFGANLQLISAEIRILDQLGFQPLLRRSLNPAVDAMINSWAGPFVEFHRYFIGGGFEEGASSQSARLNQTQVRRDFPLDPWGSPYRLYSPIGITGSPIGITTPISNLNQIDTDSFSNGNITQQDDRFDRMAVVSFGPDTTSDQTTTSGGVAGFPLLGDDIIFEFGGLVAPTETFFVVGGVPTPFP